ncbi:hypothetical protein DW768_19635 [Ruminococcus sp. AM29-26]|jgi:putative transposase|nr:hypothetical protein DW768_19635 [Ruminococcus sp. AM29-26]
MDIARKLRTWFPGAVYHIMHRGVRRKAIFQEEMDYQVLLQVLKNSLEKYKCILHAYCLMTNHIHLLLETGDMEIWKFMKYMSECYAMYLKAKVTGYSLYLFTVMQEISLYKFKDYNDRFGHKYVL